MNYKFPVINNINDVLPHIEGRSEFVVAEREDYTVINYVVAMADTFNMVDVNDFGGAIRRECRGLIFNKAGKLISRPYHKFFNVNEKEETQVYKLELDMLFDHIIMEKVDGSMIRPIISGGWLRLATKMGVTDVAEAAEKIVNYTQHEWLMYMYLAELTPILEYIAPTNKIVVEYSEPKLILTAVRDNVTGEYRDLSDFESPFEVVKIYGSVDISLEKYIALARQKEGREGDIIRFSDGHMLKIKNDWYVRIHKTKDLIRAERNIAEIIINEKLDDILPLLDATDLNTVRIYEKRFDAAIDNVLGRLEGLVTLAKVLHAGNKKEVAINFVPNLKYKDDAKFIFSALDGKDTRIGLIEHIKKSVGNTTKYDALMKWMEV